MGGAPCRDLFWYSVLRLMELISGEGDGTSESGGGSVAMMSMGNVSTASPAAC